MLMLVNQREDGKDFVLLTTEHEMTLETAKPIYTKRWHIENFFKDNSHLGVIHLPSMGLDVVQTVLSLRLLAFHAKDNFRHDLGLGYSRKPSENIYREFVDGVQSRI